MFFFVGLLLLLLLLLLTFVSFHYFLSYSYFWFDVEFTCQTHSVFIYLSFRSQLSQLRLEEIIATKQILNMPVVSSMSSVCCCCLIVSPLRNCAFKCSAAVCASIAYSPKAYFDSLTLDSIVVGYLWTFNCHYYGSRLRILNRKSFKTFVNSSTLYWFEHVQRQKNNHSSFCAPIV